MTDAHGPATKGSMSRRRRRVEAVAAMVVLLIAAAAIASVWSPSVPDGAPSVFAAPFGEGTSDLGTVCGRTEGTTNANDWSHTVVWTCAACLVPDQADRAFEMFEWVAVEPGSVLSWGIFADLGS